MADFPLWTIPLSYDFRKLLEWGLEHFPPEGADAEMVHVMETAIRDKAASVMVDRSQLDYLDRMGCAVTTCDTALRIDAYRFLDMLTATGKKKADGKRETVKVAKVVQKTMFE